MSKGFCTFRQGTNLGHKMRQANFCMGVSSKAIQKARQIAKRNRSAVACVRCKAAKSRCSDFRPCKHCVSSRVPCDDSVLKSSTPGSANQILMNTADFMCQSEKYPPSNTMQHLGCSGITSIQTMTTPTTYQPRNKKHRNQSEYFYHTLTGSIDFHACQMGKESKPATEILAQSDFLEPATMTLPGFGKPSSYSPPPWTSVPQQTLLPPLCFATPLPFTAQASRIALLN
jgi:hypothetical protein